MHEYKIYLASAAFICLTAVKLCFPSVPAQLRQQTLDILCGSSDYGSAIQAMGRSLGQGQLDSQLVQVLEYISPNAGSRTWETIQAVETCDISLPAESSVVGTESADIPDNGGQGDAWLTKYDLPDNVSPDMLQLPFEYTSPVPKAVSSGFGYREHPLDGEILFHYGTDLAAESGQSVLAFADGLITAAGTDEGYGNYYIISHDNGFTTLYAHLSEFVALEGQSVKKGQLIGYVGQTGNATGPHLHFELMHQGTYLDPEYYL